jgi:hypothetical protein
VTAFGMSMSFTGSFNIPDLTPAIQAGLQDAADAVLVAAKEGAPVLTGALRDSGNNAVEGTTAAVGFTDSKAIAAHEDLTSHVRNGKRAKFLELALQENADRAATLIASRVRGGLS